MAARSRQKDSDISVVSATGVIVATPIHIELPQFSGSLSMLFGCVRDRKVDLSTVPLQPICEAYLLYLIENAAVHLDESAAALSALTWLLERKAWLLLPVDEEPEEMESPLALPEAMDYDFWPAIEALRHWEEERSHLFFRPLDAGPEPYELPFNLESVSLDDLARALERVILRAKPEPIEVMGAPRRSISEQMHIALVTLTPKWTSLDVLLGEEFTKTDAVYWFLALLELIRIGQATVRVYEGDVQFARPK